MCEVPEQRWATTAQFKNLFYQLEVCEPQSIYYLEYRCYLIHYISTYNFREEITLDTVEACVNT